MIDTSKPISKVIYNGEEVPLDAGGSTFKDGDLNPDFAWAKKVFEETNLEGYPNKVLALMFASSKISLLELSAYCKILTSDGRTYENNSGTKQTIEHTWNDDNSKEAEYYAGEKLRWVVSFDNRGYSLAPTPNNIIYFISNAELTFSSGAGYWKALKGYEFVSGGLNFSSSQSNSAARALERAVVRKSANTSANYPSAIIKFSSYNNLMEYVKFDFDTSQVTDFSNLLKSCYKIKESLDINTDNATTMASMYEGCSSLRRYNTHNCKNVTNFSRMFSECYSVAEIDMGDTSKGENFNSTFNSCSALETLKNINLINATNVTSIFNSCVNLRNLYISNIRLSLILTSNLSWDEYLSLESLLRVIKELWDLTDGTSQTLTIKNNNRNKLADIYVKLIDVTDEMRAEDPYIDNKKPFVVCESTEEGAMSVTEYVTSKNWQLA